MKIKVAEGNELSVKDIIFIHKTFKETEKSYSDHYYLGNFDASRETLLGFHTPKGISDTLERHKARLDSLCDKGALSKQEVEMPYGLDIKYTILIDTSDWYNGE